VFCADVTHLVFTPPADANGDPYATFSFKLRDASGAVSETAYTMTIAVTATNDPPVVEGFAAWDPTEIRPGFTNNREIGVAIQAVDADNALTGWLITEDGIPPAPNDPRWLADAPTGYHLVSPPGTVVLYAWGRDAEDGVSAVSTASQCVLELDLETVFELSFPGHELRLRFAGQRPVSIPTWTRPWHYHAMRRSRGGPTRSQGRRGLRAWLPTSGRGKRQPAGA
jgi:hypothetical protein